MSADNQADIIIHKKCGLPVELCICSGAPVKYDWKKDKFIDRGKDETNKRT